MSFKLWDWDWNCIALLITSIVHHFSIFSFPYIIQPSHHLHNGKPRDGLTLEMLAKKIVNHHGTMMRVLVHLHHHQNNVVPPDLHVVREKTTHKAAAVAAVDGMIAAVADGMTSPRITHRMNRISTTNFRHLVEVEVEEEGIETLTRVGGVLGVDVKVVGVVVTDVKVAGVAIDGETDGVIGVQVKVDDSLIAVKILDQTVQEKEVSRPISKRLKMQGMNTYTALHQY